AGAIAGTVRDSTGAVLPGATIEASSPALIEKVRSAVSDAGGQYRIVDLRPGIYTVSFSLSGFSTVRREGIELTTGFTANVNADLKIGDIAETITVTGQTPVVDVQNTSQRAVLSRDVLDTIPSGRLYYSVADVTPGITSRSNAGASTGGSTGRDGQTLKMHGAGISDFLVLVDGMPQTDFVGPPIAVMPNDGLTEEANLQTGANPAEADSGGVRV